MSAPRLECVGPERDTVMRRHALVAVGSATVAMLLALTGFIRPAFAQADGDNPGAPQVRDAADSPDSANRVDPSTPASASKPPEKGQSKVESALFYYLYMTGTTQADFKPLTSGERVKFYAKGLFGPFQFLAAASSAGITQWEDVPSAWGQGAEGYGHRFGNYFAKQSIQRTLRLGLEEVLHEDNRYFTSGEHGFGRRILYALERSVLARKDDGTSRISMSEILSTAGASFTSRLWQPPTNNSAGDGAVSFGIGMASNAGLNVLREFLPDITKRVFRHSQPN